MPRLQWMGKQDTFTTTVGQSQGSRAATVALTRGGIIPEKCTEMESEEYKEQREVGEGDEGKKGREEWSGERKGKRDLSWEHPGHSIHSKLFIPHYGSLTL